MITKSDGTVWWISDPNGRDVGLFASPMDTLEPQPVGIQMHAHLRAMQMDIQDLALWGQNRTSAWSRAET